MKDNFKKAILFVAIGLLTVSIPLFAHHGNAAYDYEKTMTVKGTVVEWAWANPHCLMKFDVKDDKGEVQHWVIEASNPPDMAKAGWTKTTFKPGDELTIDIMPVKNGGTYGRFRKVTLADGTVLKGGGSRFVL